MTLILALSSPRTSWCCLESGVKETILVSLSFICLFATGFPVVVQADLEFLLCHHTQLYVIYYSLLLEGKIISEYLSW